MRSLFALAFLFGTATFVAAEAEADATQAQLRTLAEYPKDVRQAILELLNHPAVLNKIDKDGTGVEKAVKGEKPPVQESARLLAKNPEVLKLLKDNPDALALAAKAYADNKKKVLAQLDEEDKSNDKAADDWAARLEGDQEALQQLKDAAAAYAKAPGGAAMGAGLGSSGDTVVVNTLPSPGFVSYVMTNADRYPALGNVMTSQWLSSRNPAGYDRAFHHWWSGYAPHFNDSLLHADEHRANRLGELARFDRQHANVERTHRYDNFQRHAKDFPHLGKLPPHDPKRNTPLAGMHHKPNHPDGHLPGKGPRRAGPAGKSHHPVQHKHGSQAHHMHHAHASHQHHAQHHGGHRK